MKNAKFSYIWGVLAIGIVAFILYQSLFGKRSLCEIYNLNKYYGQLVNNVVCLHGENKELQNEIERLKRLPFQTEKTAREELGLVRPGEVVYKFKQTKEH